MCRLERERKESRIGKQIGLGFRGEGQVYREPCPPSLRKSALL